MNHFSPSPEEKGQGDEEACFCNTFETRLVARTRSEHKLGNFVLVFNPNSLCRRSDLIH